MGAQRGMAEEIILNLDEADVELGRSKYVPAPTPDQFLMAPEPNTFGLLALGGVAVLSVRRRIRR